jgi:hypothetical protein
MNSPQPPELFAERPVRSDYARERTRISPIALGVIGLLVVAAIGGIYAAFSSQAPQQAGDIPTIKAEGVYKQRPEQPGGIDIPHQDMQVYQAIEGSQQAAAEQPKVERLLPPPETPMAATTVASVAPQLLKPQLAQAEPDAVTEKVAAAAAPVEPLTRPTAIATTVVETAKPQPAPVAAAKPVVPVVPEPKAPAAAAAKPVEAKPLITGKIPQDLLDGSASRKFMVQLASFPDATIAEKQLKSLQAKYASLLGATRLRMVKANLGAKGTYYRIQSEGLSTDQASKICAGVWSQKGQCMIVKP